MSRLLINENPLQVLPTLALKIGLNEAMVLQQMHYWLNPDHNKNYFQGHHWVFNSYEEWHKQFPFWSLTTLKRIIYSLEQQRFIVSSYLSEDKLDRRKWYTINYPHLEALSSLNSPLSQNGQVHHPNMASCTSPIWDGVYKEQRLHTENTFSPSSSSSSFGSSEEEKENIANEMKEIWLEEIGSVEISQLTPSLILSLYQSFQSLFSSSLVTWRSYCRKIASSKFLMGEGGNKHFQKPWLTWAIKAETFHKIESGQFTLGDRIAFLPEAKSEEDKAEKKEELRQEILTSSYHPLWKQVCLILTDKLEVSIIRQWLLEMDIVSCTQEEVCIKAPTLFARDWINKNLKSQIALALEEALGHPVDHLTIETPQNFGTLPMPEFVEGETPNSSPSTPLNNPSFDAHLASNAEEQGVPRSSSLTYPSSLNTVGSFFMERTIEPKYEISGEVRS